MEKEDNEALAVSARQARAARCWAGRGRAVRPVQEAIKATEGVREIAGQRGRALRVIRAPAGRRAGRDRRAGAGRARPERWRTMQFSRSRSRRWRCGQCGMDTRADAAAGGGQQLSTTGGGGRAGRAGARASRRKRRAHLDVDRHRSQRMIPTFGVNFEPFGIGGTISFGGANGRGLHRPFARVTRGVAATDVRLRGRPSQPGSAATPAASRSGRFRATSPPVRSPDLQAVARRRRSGEAVAERECRTTGSRSRMRGDRGVPHRREERQDHQRGASTRG